LQKIVTTTGTASSGGTLSAAINSSGVMVAFKGYGLVWSGTPSGNWQIGGNSNWLNGVLPAAYVENNGLGSLVTFDDTAAGTTTVVLNTNVHPAEVHFNISSTAYALTGTGSVLGANNWTKSGTGALTIANTGPNNFNGSVAISGGTIALGNGGAGGDLGAADIQNNGSLVFNRSGSATFSNSISGSGQVTVIGSGTVQLAGTNTYTGGTAINGGVLNAGIAQNGTTSGPLGASGNIAFGGGTLQFSSASSTWDPSARIAAGTSLNAVSIDPNGQNLTFAMALTASQSGGLTLNDTAVTKGSLTLTGINTYTGNTTISAGTLGLSGSGSLSTPKIILASDAKFDVSGLSTTFALGSGQTVTNISGTGLLVGNVNLASGALALNYTNGTPSLSVSNGTLAFNGNAVTINVSGSLTHGVYKLVSTNTGGLVTGTLPSSVTVNGDIGAAGASLSLVNNELYLTVNHVPVAGNATYARNAGIYTLHIGISDLLTNVTDLDGDTITLVGTGTSTNGIVLITGGTNYLYYYNTNNVSDQFSYTVTDGFGGTNSGLVNIVINNAAPGQITGQFTSFSNNVANLTFYGMPNNSYITERTTNLTDWRDIATNTAATNGVINMSDTFSDLGGVPPPSAYYRLKSQP
jgi:autotransporter-associated beta strand protein